MTSLQTKTSDQSTASQNWCGLPPLAVGLLTVVVVAVYGWLFLAAESNTSILALLAAALIAAVLAGRSGLARTVTIAMEGHSNIMNGGVLVALLVIMGIFSTEHFPLLMITTVLLYMIASWGMTVQFGFAGMVNFAGAAFLGIGAYTSAVLTAHTSLPPLLIVLLGGIVSALIGLILVVPVVRTRGHYAALVTIAFSVLFTTFLQVNDTLGGPQGLMVNSMSILGWDFNDSPTIFGPDASFYLNYALLTLVIAVIAFMLVRRLERSWVGLTLDSVRLDETSSACFGLGVRRAKVLAFTFGNLLTGIAGALYGMMISFIAPSSFTFSDSLLLVAMVLLGGMGSPWGAALATVIVIMVPEKLQVIQEYRFLLFSVLVIVMLLFRPQGLLPRAVRSFIPGWRPSR